MNAQHLRSLQGLLTWVKAAGEPHSIAHPARTISQTLIQLSLWAISRSLTRVNRWLKRTRCERAPSLGSRVTYGRWPGLLVSSWSACQKDADPHGPGVPKADPPHSVARAHISRLPRGVSDHTRDRTGIVIVVNVTAQRRRWPSQKDLISVAVVRFRCSWACKLTSSGEIPAKTALTSARASSVIAALDLLFTGF